MMKKITIILIACLFCIGSLLFYRNQRITCFYEKNAEYQTVKVQQGLFIEEPHHSFQLPKNAQGTDYLITTDTFIPVLALYNRNAVQTFITTYLFHNNSLASQIQLIETDKYNPVRFDKNWELLEKTDKSSLSYSEEENYKHYRILLETKEIYITLQKRMNSEIVEPEIIECIMENYSRLSE